MASHHPSTADELLHSVEAVDEIFRIGHCRHIASHLAQALCKGRTAETLLAEREIDVVEARALVVHQHGADHLAHIVDLAATAHDHRSGSDDLLTVRILLRHRQRILTRRNIHAECAAEVAQGFHSTVQTGILAFLRTARPHPVGRERHALQALCKRGPYHIRERLSD